MRKAHPELLGDLAHVPGFAFVSEARVAGDHEQPAQARERGNEILGDAVGKVLLLGIATHIRKGQDRERGPVERLGPSFGRRSRACIVRDGALQHLSEPEAGMAFHNRERAIRKEPDKKLLDGRLAELRLKGELLPRDALAGEIVPDRRRNPPFVAYPHRCRALERSRRGAPSRRCTLGRPSSKYTYGPADVFHLILATILQPHRDLALHL